MAPYFKLPAREYPSERIERDAVEALRERNVGLISDVIGGQRLNG